MISYIKLVFAITMSTLVLFDKKTEYLLIDSNQLIWKEVQSRKGQPKTEEEVIQEYLRD